jgi:anti-anti-sigma factor
MEIGYRFIGEVLIISFYGELHSEQTELVEFRVKELVAKADKIIINCGDLEYLDSRGLGSLVRIDGKVKKLNGELVLCSVSGKVEKVFKLTRFYKYIKVFGDVEEASKYFEEKK